MTCFSLLLVYHRLLLELQSEGTLTPEQSLRVKEWLNSVEEEPSRLTTASGPDSGIENSSTEDAVALRRGRPSLRNQVCVLSLSQVWVQLGEVCSTDMSTRGFFNQDPEAAEERWSREHDTDKGGENEDGVAELQAQIQRLERENTDFLAALEDAMEQYKQQVKHGAV